MSPAVSLSAEATSSPSSGVAQNFTNPVTYTVTAMDGTTTQAYVVTVTVEASTPVYEFLHDFTGGAANGLTPNGSLTLSGTKLYGMTMQGGTSNKGTIFSINTDGTGFSVLKSFAGGVNDGSDPTGNLTLYGTKLYGMTQAGGTGNYGIIFSINTDGTEFNLLQSLDGLYPLGSLTLSGTKLYGMGSYGGPADQGTIFSINTDGTGFSVLKSFDGETNDVLPMGDLTISASGTKLYGMTNGGESFLGTIFSINTDGTEFANLRNFTGIDGDGAKPTGNLTLYGTKLYGMTPSGGTSGTGIIFSINTDGTGFTNLKSFTAGTDDGSQPMGSLTLSGTKFYGFTRYGGVANKGILFSINTDGTGFSVLKSFAGGSTDGSQPYSSLSISESKLYGMTALGGSLDKGTIFSYAYNLSPTLAGVSVSPEIVKGGSEITITAVGPSDPEGGALNFYSNETGDATSGTTMCSQGDASYDSPYASTTCTYNVPTGDGTRTVYSRTFDGSLYSTERTATYIVDSTGPTLSFSEDVLAGPVTLNDITAGWGDAVIKKWDYNSTNSCPTASSSYTKTYTDSMDQSTQDNNTKYICLYAEDAVGNSTTIASAYAINIDVSSPSAVSASLVANSTSQITATSQTASDSNSLAASPYSFIRNNGLFASGWQASNVYVDTGLSPNTQYFYQVQTKDSLGNESEYLDSISNKYTLAPVPTNFVAAADGTSINLSVDTFSNATSGSSGYYFERNGGENSGWIQTNIWTDTGLSSGTEYSYTVKYRNGDGVETSTETVSVSTQAQASVPVQRTSSSGSYVYGNLSKIFTTPTDSVNKITFSRDLKLKDIGNDIKLLQEYLNANGFLVAKKGPGSKGNETTIFGPATKSALIKFQKANKIPATGYFESSTRNFINQKIKVAPENVQTQNPEYTNNDVNFTTDLKLGDTNEQVRLLQKTLNAQGFVVSKSGPGSKGNETTKFGPATKSALIKFQKANKISPATGYFGPTTRSLVNGLQK